MQEGDIMDKIAFGKRIKSVRNEQKITAEALGEICSLTPTFIRHIEGGSKMPSVDSLVILCNKLNVSPDYLLCDSLISDDKKDFELLWNKSKSLTPKQRVIVMAMIDTLVEQLDF